MKRHSQSEAQPDETWGPPLTGPVMGGGGCSMSPSLVKWDGAGMGPRKVSAR